MRRKRHMHFSIELPDGTYVMVKGDPEMSGELKDALRAMALAAKKAVGNGELGYFNGNKWENKDDNRA